MERRGSFIETYYFTTGMLIRLYRLRKNYSQAEMGNLLKVSVPTISKWENGAARPTPGHCRKMEELFGASITPRYLGIDKGELDKVIRMAKDRNSLLQSVKAEFDIMNAWMREMNDRVTNLIPQSQS